MTNRSVAALVLKIWGVMWLVSALTGLVNTGLQLVEGQFGNSRSLWMYAVRSNTLSWVFSFLVGLVLVKAGDRIARAVFPREEDLRIAADDRRLQTLGFSLLAMYFAIPALRGIVSGLYGMLSKPPEDSVKFAWERNREHFVGSLADLVAAVLLFFGAPTLARFMRRLQEPWTSPKEPPAEPAE